MNVNDDIYETFEFPLLFLYNCGLFVLTLKTTL